jgi:DNA-binding NarL/FixJ family response regulator
MRILIADSQSKVRNALCVLLRHQPGLEIVGAAGSAVELLGQVEGTRPDLVLVHWRLEGATGKQLVKDLRARYPGLRLLVLSVRPESRQDALAAGADAFVSKMDQPEILLAAIQCFRQANDADPFPAEGSRAADAQEPSGDQRRQGAPPRSFRATSPATS